MTIDGATLFAQVRELSGVLIGARIEKIFQPVNFVVYLQCSKDRTKFCLALSADTGEPFIMTTDVKEENPKIAPNFCMVLRKHITGGRITSVNTHGYERIVSVNLLARDEMGYVAEYCLNLEIMGKYSNIILVKDGKIVDGIKRIPLDASTVRQVLPGLSFTLPERTKKNVDVLDVSQIETFLIPDNLERSITANFEGVSAVIAREVIAGGGGDIPGVARELKRFFKALDNPNPTVYYDENATPVFFSAMPFVTYSGVQSKTFLSVNEAVSAYYSSRRANAVLGKRKNDLLKTLGRLVTKLQKKLAIALETIADGAKTDEISHLGQLISANIYRMERGQTELLAEDYSTGKTVKIPLDIKLSPAKNAAVFYKRAGKLKRGAVIAKTMAESYKKELDFLEEAEFSVSSATDTKAVEDIKIWLAELKYIELPKGKYRPKEQSSPYEYTSPNGFKILAGRNPAQNDRLSLSADGSDLWFHARNMPGAHVILFAQGKTAPDEDIEYAASVAARHSKSHGEMTEIDYCPRQNVYKLKGAKPGMVQYSGHNSIRTAGLV